MNTNKLLVFSLVLFGVLFNACKDDPDDEDKGGPDYPHFTYDYSWDDEYISHVEDYQFNASGRPNSFETVIDAGNPFPESYDYETLHETAFYHPDDTTYTSRVYNIVVVDINGNDTTSQTFGIVTDELSIGKYEFGDFNIIGEILGNIFGGGTIDVEGLEGKVLPSYFSKSQWGLPVSFSGFFGGVDYADSYIEIEEIDSEAKTISGSLYLDLTIREEDEDTGEKTVIKVFKSSNGTFKSVPLWE